MIESHNKLLKVWICVMLDLDILTIWKFDKNWRQSKLDKCSNYFSNLSWWSFVLYTTRINPFSMNNSFKGLRNHTYSLYVRCIYDNSVISR